MTTCPTCGHSCDAASTALGNHITIPGDLGYCARCSVALFCQENWTMRLVPLEEYLHLTIQERKPMCSFRSWSAFAFGGYQ